MNTFLYRPYRTVCIGYILTICAQYVLTLFSSFNCYLVEMRKIPARPLATKYHLVTHLLHTYIICMLIMHKETCMTIIDGTTKVCIICSTQHLEKRPFIMCERSKKTQEGPTAKLDSEELLLTVEATAQGGS